MSFIVTKISALTELAEVPADTDELPLVDDSADATKRNKAGYMRRCNPRIITSSGAQSGAGESDLHLVLDHGSAINYTITGAPTPGDIMTIYANTGATHTVILSGSVTWDGTNKTATFNAIGESLWVRARSATRWDVISNNGVTFSA